MERYEKGILSSLEVNDDFEYSKKDGKVRSLVCAFDIETSSWFRIDGKDYSQDKFYDIYDKLDEKKRKDIDKKTQRLSCMYLWQFGIEDNTYYGRTWEEYEKFINEFRDIFCKNCKTIVWVHNLSYEFQFLRKRFKIVNSFSVKNRQPIFVELEGGIILRDSLVLSRKTLELMGEDVGIDKLIGFLDYKIIRTPETPLYSKELLYGERDIRILISWIRKKKQEEKGKLTNIPLTMTGYARREMRNACLFDSNKSVGSNISYRKLMSELKITADEYVMLKKAFRGGFCHAASEYVGNKLENIGSYDFCSKYISVMIYEQFPMSSGLLVENPSDELVIRSLNNSLCILDVTIDGLTDKYKHEHFLSSNTCDIIESPILDNGRVVSAKKIRTTMTNIDFHLFNRCYDYKGIEVNKIVIYEKKGFLPRPFCKKLLDFYEKKTKYKDSEPDIVEYTLSKTVANGCFGLLVEDIKHVAYDIDSNGDWGFSDSKVDVINKYNENKNRFTFYPWGVFLTSYARRDIWDAIFELGDDYVYSDTDSVKFKNNDIHKQFFDDYNEYIEDRMRFACKVRGIDDSKLSPLDAHGKERFIGVFTKEKTAKEFKTLGAKRYMQRAEDGEFKIAISGVSKKAGSAFFNANPDPFQLFNFDFVIPRNSTGKLTHLYVDEEIKGSVEDYMGIIGNYDEKSYVHLSDAEYSLGISKSFDSFLSILC